MQCNACSSWNKWISGIYVNLDESLKCVKKKVHFRRVDTVWYHLYDVLKRENQYYVLFSDTN